MRTQETIRRGEDGRNMEGVEFTVPLEEEIDPGSGVGGSPTASQELGLEQNVLARWNQSWWDRPAAILRNAIDGAGDGEMVVKEEQNSRTSVLSTQHMINKASDEHSPESGGGDELSQNFLHLTNFPIFRSNSQTFALLNEYYLEEEERRRRRYPVNDVKFVGPPLHN
ncbi:hypothetical protein B0H10DRAFT_1959232 [Mycena sp. CBHHK59/15]|nr:hypothetical protein B0H10DRAFT_1959232 [Mycena sp. CBHHK59/15]